MSRYVRFLAIVAVLLGLGLRLAEVHSHEGALHPENCVYCRVLSTPLTTPLAVFTPAAILTADRPETAPTSETPLAQPPVLDGRLLRAPPDA